MGKRRHILQLKDLGYEGAWLLVQQACGIPDARARSTFLEDMTVALLFAQDAFPERLCMTAAVRQMGGHVVYVNPGDWKYEVAKFPLEMGNIVSYYVDCVMIYGMDLSTMRKPSDSSSIPVINGGCPTTHPMNALADIACMQQCVSDLAKAVVAWVGCPNGTLHTFVDAMSYFPYQLRISVPEGTADAALLQKAAAAGHTVEVARTPQEAVRGANFICAGCLESTDEPAGSGETWFIDEALLENAAPNARIMLSAAPTCSTPIAETLLQGKHSLLLKQAENRLRVCKRMLHWVFSDE